MATDASRGVEVQRLLKAYRKGLISDESVDDQMSELASEDGPVGAAAPTAKAYIYNGTTFATEREMVARFLDDFRAAESFGGEVLALWADAAREPIVRGGLRNICARERNHGQLLAERLQELGAECRADLSTHLKEAARARLASTAVSDLEKLEDFVARCPNIEAAVRPIREVVAQIEDDLETKALLNTILDDEIATLRWMAATCEELAAAGSRARSSRS
jgi:ferritin-like protein